MCWKLRRIFSAQGKVGSELFYLALSSEELISPNRKPTQALEAGLAWALEPGQTLRVSMKTCLIKESDDV